MSGEPEGDRGALRQIALIRFDVSDATFVDDHNSRTSNEPMITNQRGARIAVDPKRWKARDIATGEPDKVRYPAQRAVGFVSALCAAQERKQHEPGRDADDREIDDAALPYLVPDMLLGAGALRRLLPRLEAIFIRRDNLAGVFPHHIVERRQADRRVGVRVIGETLENAFVDFRAPDDDFVVLLLPRLR